MSSYHHCASVLERELGITPDEQTRAVLNRLLTLRPAAPDRQPPVAPAAPPPSERSGLASAQLVGRAAELDALLQSWRRAAAGEPAIALVRGAVGVGKTRLVTELADVARLSTAVVAKAQCFGSSGRLALAPVADWLRERRTGTGPCWARPSCVAWPRGPANGAAVTTFGQGDGQGHPSGCSGRSPGRAQDVHD